MLLAAFPQYFFGISIFISSLFLILLVLVQRGRGGGLTGALGGPGGQSAFGTKAGDLFTRITIGVAVVWILLCASSVFFLKSRGLPTLGKGSAAGATGAVGSPASEDTPAEGTTGSVPGLGTPSGPDVTGLGLPNLQSGGADDIATEEGSEVSTESDAQAEVTEFPSDGETGEDAVDSSEDGPDSNSDEAGDGETEADDS